MASTLALNATLALPSSARRIPQLGFGVYRSKPSEVCIKSCLTALHAGYRHIDTAQLYGNEREVGDAIRQSGIPRSELFITTKIMTPGEDFDSTYSSVLESVKKIDGDNGYVDLFLIHTPTGGKEARQVMWLALEKLKEAGKAREIGVSNYSREHIEEIQSFGKIWPPAVNQIELHPWCQQRKTVAYCKSQGIVIEAYCPLVRNRKADNPILLSLAEKHQRGSGQILIRYSLQKGWVPLPKSDTPSRIEGNRQVYDFELDADDIEKLDGLDEEEKGAMVRWVG